MSDDLHELAAPYALDALDEFDTARFVSHLEECEECQASVVRFQESLIPVARASAEAPPQAVKDRVLAALATMPQVGQRPARRRLPLIAVAALVAVLALLAWSTLSPGRLINAILRDPGAVTTLAAPTDSGTGVFKAARLVYSEELDAAVLVVEGLAQPVEGQTYEIWLIDDTTPTPAGLFRPDQDGAATVRVEGDVAPGLVVAVTQEPEGGVVAPTGEPLLAVGIGA